MLIWHTLIKKAGMNMSMSDKKKEKRELHIIEKCVILFFFTFFFSIIIDNSYESTKVGYVGAADKVVTMNEGATSQDSDVAVDILVVIDPGHGGNDPGKVSTDGILEKDVNLEISFKLQEELNRRGIGSIMLREEDKNLATEGATNKKVSDMKNRVSIINESNADILISIHQNSYTAPEVRGPQVFYHSDSKDSESFAKLLQEKLKAINPDYAREAKTGDDYYILNESICPGVIVECGFLSCPSEVALLVDDEYQQKIASAIADAIEEVY